MRNLKKGDYFIVIGILTLSLSIILFGFKNSETATAIIRQDGVVLHEISLTGLKSDLKFEVNSKNGGFNIITAKNGKIAFSSASCAHQTCVKTGEISRAGQSAVCLENKVSITIVGGDAPDIIAK